MTEALTNPENLVLGIAMIGMFFTIILLGMPLLSQDTLSSRLKAVARRREELSAAHQISKGPVESQIRLRQGKSYVRKLVDRLRLLNPANSDDIRLLLAQAGKRGQGALYTYAFFRFVAPLIFGFLTFIYLFFIGRSDMDSWLKLTISGGAMVIGFFLPYMLIKNAVSKRQQILTRGFPDALDLMVICVEAGLSMEAAFQRVADEIQDDSPELAEELGLTTAELAFLPNRAEALAGLSQRTGLESVKSLVTALSQAEKYGTPVSVALKVISQEQRDARLSRAEKKAGALPAQLTVPMIVFFLPVLFVVILGPAILKTIKTLAN